MEPIIYEVLRNKKNKRLFPIISEREEKKFQRLTDTEISFLLNTKCPDSTKELLKFILKLRKIGCKPGEEIPEKLVVELKKSRGKLLKIEENIKMNNQLPAVNHNPYEY